MKTDCDSLFPIYSFQMLTYDNKGDAYIVEKRRIKGIFMENLELKDFPFDVQV